MNYYKYQKYKIKYIKLKNDLIQVGNGDRESDHKPTKFMSKQTARPQMSLSDHRLQTQSRNIREEIFSTFKSIEEPFDVQSLI